MPETFLEQAQYRRAVLNAIPSLIFIVDRDLRVIDANSSALTYIDKEADLVLKRLCGEVLHCLHEADHAEGCGRTPLCEDCVLRAAVNAVCQTNETYRDRHRLRQRRNGTEEFAEFFVTASPLVIEGQMLVLMVLEDVTELLALRHLVTMCSVCSSIRNENGEWEKVHQYLSRKENIVCSHGLCPSCFEEQCRNVAEIQQLIAAASVHNSGPAS